MKCAIRSYILRHKWREGLTLVSYCSKEITETLEDVEKVFGPSHSFLDTLDKIHLYQITTGRDSKLCADCLKQIIYELKGGVN